MPRTKRAGDKYEDDLHVRVATYLRHVLYTEGPNKTIWWHTPNGARYDPSKAAATAARLAVMGLLPGIPDFLLAHRGEQRSHGALFGFDVKSLTGRASEAQIAVAADLADVGIFIADPIQHPVRTVEEAEDLLVGWGIPLKFRFREIKEKTLMKPHEAQALTAILQADKGQKASRDARFRRKARAAASPPLPYLLPKKSFASR
jgi:hypothetical protein